MPFTSSNALGKLRIVTACGIGGAPLLRTSALRGVPPLTALTQTLVHHLTLFVLDKSATKVSYIPGCARAWEGGRERIRGSAVACRSPVLTGGTGGRTALRQRASGADRAGPLSGRVPRVAASRSALFHRHEDAVAELAFDCAGQVPP